MLRMPLPRAPCPGQVIASCDENYALASGSVCVHEHTWQLHVYPNDRNAQHVGVYLYPQTTPKIDLSVVYELFVIGKAQLSYRCTERHAYKANSQTGRGAGALCHHSSVGPWLHDGALVLACKIKSVVPKGMDVVRGA